MPSYWWQCSSCNGIYEFSVVTKSKGIAHFIWDELIPDWDQTMLKRMCKQCNTQSLNITYKFPSVTEPIEQITLIHAVGLNRFNKYVPMMWETKPYPNEEMRWFDFKYIIGRSMYGLTRPAVFEKDALAEIFEMYKRVTGEKQFP